MKWLLLHKGNIISKKSAYFRRFLEKRDSLTSSSSSLIMLLPPSPQKLSSSTERLSSDMFPLRQPPSMIEYSLLNPVPCFKKNELWRNIQWGEISYYKRGWFIIRGSMISHHSQQNRIKLEIWHTLPQQ
ncbi:hypothetical protein, unlikely [Trypanosoma congolense IL3000]|uniref:Uncharacterized protein n=1 Tax=Trypanosoma congolense (strain IL3000) TaxID=1068625 RepID=F9WAW0_TRYCI|nr:hypothetical protein, unlikely [Trypanosoma congolense IL3000]